MKQIMKEPEWLHDEQRKKNQVLFNEWLDRAKNLYYEWLGANILENKGFQEIYDMIAFFESTDEYNWYKENGYICFHEKLDRLIYTQIHKGPAKECPIPYYKMYCLCTEMIYISDCATKIKVTEYYLQKIEKAVDWCPYSAILSLKFWAVKIMMKLDEKELPVTFLVTLMKIRPYCYRVSVLADYYSALGMFFKLQKMDKNALACYELSEYYKDSIGRKAIAVQYENETEFPGLDKETISLILGNYGHTVLPEKSTIDLAYDCGIYAMTHGQWGEGAYYFKIIRDLKYSSDIHNMLIYCNEKQKEMAVPYEKVFEIYCWEIDIAVRYVNDKRE